MENATQMEQAVTQALPEGKKEVHIHVMNSEFAYIASAVIAIQVFILLVTLLPFIS